MVGMTILIALFEEPRPVFDRACQEACKNKVKGSSKIPVVLYIIYIKLGVGRDKRWLDRAEIDASDLERARH